MFSSENVMTKIIHTINYLGLKLTLTKIKLTTVLLYSWAICLSQSTYSWKSIVSSSLPAPAAGSTLSSVVTRFKVNSTLYIMQYMRPFSVNSRDNAQRTMNKAACLHEGHKRTRKMRDRVSLASLCNQSSQQLYMEAMHSRKDVAAGL